MKHTKVTPWFSGDKKPSRAGMYQVANLFGERWEVWSYWDGKKWGFQCDTKKDAFYHRHWKSGFQCKTWRGLTHEAH